jgi:hypothetical protein
LAVFLFLGVDGQREHRVDALVIEIHVAINFILSDRAVSVFDVLKEVTDEDVIETFVSILDFGIVYGFDDVRCLVDGDASGVLEDLPFFFGIVVEGS